MENSAVLNLVGVAKSFGDRKVLNDLDLYLEQGECLALLGPNGAGKSTTIQIALGLASATEGHVSVLGHEMPAQSHLARQQIGVVPQYDALDPDFTVFENLIVFGGYFGIPKATLTERARQLVDFASLNSRAQDAVTSLSGGMRRRLTLARALVNKPQLLFLDEPTTALDPQAKHLIWERLMQLKRQGISIFLTTHFMDEAQRLADRVAVLDGGRIIATGTPADLIQQYVGSTVLEVWGASAQTWIEKLEPGDGVVTEQRGETFYLQGEVAKRMLDRLNAIKPEGVEFLYRPGNLEDVFFRLTRRDLRDD